MSDEDFEKLSQHDRAIVKATVSEFMRQVSAGVGRTVIEKLFWIAVGVAIWATTGQHIGGGK